MPRSGNGHNYVNIPVPANLKYVRGDQDARPAVIKPVLVAKCKRGVGNIAMMVRNGLEKAGWENITAKVVNGWTMVYGIPPMLDDDNQN